MRYFSDTSHLISAEMQKKRSSLEFERHQCINRFQAKNDSGLDLSRRGLKTWPVELFNLRQLESLDLSLGISDNLAIWGCYESHQKGVNMKK